MKRRYFVGFKPWISGFVFSCSGCCSDMQSIISYVDELSHSDIPTFTEEEIYDRVVELSAKNPYGFTICCISNYELASLIYCELNGIAYEI